VVKELIAVNNIKFLYFTDIHVSDHNPQNRLGNYKMDILNKLTQIGDIGNKNEVDFFMCGGDLFDHKAPTRNSHKMNKELM